MGALRPYHVGDSTNLLTGQRGKLEFAMISHSPTGYAMEAGVLGEEEALVHEDRHDVSNLLGAAANACLRRARSLRSPKI